MEENTPFMTGTNMIIPAKFAFVTVLSRISPPKLKKKIG